MCGSFLKSNADSGFKVSLKFLVSGFRVEDLRGQRVEMVEGAKEVEDLE